MDKPFSVRDMPVTNSGSSQGLVNNLIQQYNTPIPPKPVKGGFSDTMSQTTSFLNEFATDKTIRDTHTKLNDGTWVAKYDSYSPFRDNEAYHAENQTSGDKWANGAIKFLGKTGTAILGGTIGTVYGVKEMLREGSLSALYDNDLTRKFDDWNVTMDIKNPNYYTQSEQDMNFFQSMGTANFWANDFLGGLSFTVGAIGSEIIWGGLTGGASLATVGGRWGAKLGAKFGASKAAKTAVKDVLEGTTKKEAIQAMENSMFKGWSLPANVSGEAVSKSVKQASVFGAKAGALANTVRFGITSAGYESSVEALQLKKELQDNFYDDFQRKNGRVPTSEEITSFNEKVNQASDGLFFYNLALVGASNTAVLGKVFDIKNPLTAPSKWVNKKVFGVGLDQATNTVVKANRAQKVMQKSYSILSPMFMEGVVEEGGQAVGSGAAKSWVEASYDPKYTKDSLTLGDAFIDSLVETYTTKEGWKEIGLGALIGALSGGAGSVYNRARGRETEGQFTRLQREANEMMAFNKDYSPHSMANMLVYANRVQNANQAEDVAEQEGNFTLSEKVRRDKALAQLSYAYNLDFFSETVDQTIKGLNALDEVQLAEERGVSVEEARAEKEKAIEDYTQIAKEFKLNRDFADSFFGDVLSREGLDYVQTNTLKEAVAYELTQGSRSWEFSRDLLSAIQTELSGVVGAENVLRIGDVLNQATPEVKRELDQVTKELFENESKLEELNVRRKNVAYVRTNDIEVNRERANTANNLALDIAELTERKQQLENRYNILLETANLNNPFTNESSPIVTTADILNLEQSLNKIKASANSNSKLKGLIEEYQRVSKDLVRHSILNKQLKDPKLQAEGSKGLSRLLLGKGRKLNDLTKEFIEGIQSSMDYVREVDTATKLRALETVDESIETVQEAETIKTQPTQQQEEVSQAQQIINANIAYFQPVGIQTEEDLDNTFPTQEEVAEFETLYNKAKSDENFSEYDDVETIESGALTEAEQARFNDLYDKLEKWQMLQVAENEEGVSLADIVQQTYQNSQVGKAENQEVSLDEFSEIVVEGTTAQAADRRTENLSQTPDGVQVRESKGKYTVHNISLPSFLSQVGSQDIVVIEEDGEYQVLPQAVDSTPGTKVRIDYSEDQHTVLTVGEGGVIEIENEIPLFNNSNYSIVSYSGQSGSSYSPLYEKTSGNPVLSDFNQDGTYNPQAIYNLNQGDVIYFRVDMDNSYNQSLKGQSDEYVEKQVKVFLVDQSGNVLGDLKAYQNVLGSDGFNTVRRLALEQFKAGKSGNLSVTSKVNSVILGVPNFTLNEEGLPSPKNFNSDNVVDWGYWDGKKFNLRNGTNEVRETFTKKFKRNVPVVVFSIGNQLVAFPINLRSTAQPSNINLLDIINDESQSLAKQVIRINELLISRGFSGNLKYLGDDNQNIFSNVETQEMSEEFKTAQENLNTVQAPPNIIDMDMAGLAEVAITPIDFSNRPLMSPRIAIDLKVGQGTMDETVQVVENEKVVEKPNPQKVTQEVNKKVEKVVKQTNNSTTAQEVVVPITEAQPTVSQQPTSNIIRKVKGTDVEYTVKPFSKEDVETINNIRHLLERGDTVFPNGSSGVYEYNGTTLNLVRGNGASTLTDFSKGMKIYKSQFNSQKELESGNTIEPDQSLINQSKKEQNKNCKN